MTNQNSASKTPTPPRATSPRGPDAGAATAVPMPLPSTCSGRGEDSLASILQLPPCYRVHSDLFDNDGADDDTDDLFHILDQAMQIVNETVHLYQDMPDEDVPSPSGGGRFSDQ